MKAEGPPRTCHLVSACCSTHGVGGFRAGSLGTHSPRTPGSPRPQGLFFQDKYLADMDELFSQVDEKRKVSVSWHALPFFPHPELLTPNLLLVRATNSSVFPASPSDPAPPPTPLLLMLGWSSPS